MKTYLIIAVLFCAMLAFGGAVFVARADIYTSGTMDDFSGSNLGGPWESFPAVGPDEDIGRDLRNQNEEWDRWREQKKMQQQIDELKRRLK